MTSFSRMNNSTVLGASLLMIFSIVGCASGPKSQTTQVDSTDKVVARIDELQARPSWLKESEPFRVIDGSVVSLGQTTIPGDNRVEAAFRIAENNGKASIASAIEQRLEFIFQNAEEGTAIDSTQARYIGAEASKITSSAIRPQNRYWEKVSVMTDSGQRVTRYKVFVAVAMPEQDFKNAVLEAIRKSSGKSGLSADFASKVDKHWDKFSNADSNGDQTKQQ